MVESSVLFSKPERISSIIECLCAFESNVFEKKNSLAHVVAGSVEPSKRSEDYFDEIGLPILHVAYLNNTSTSL